MCYLEGAVVEAVNQVCLDDSLDTYEDDDMFLALILCLMGQGFGGGENDLRYSADHVSCILTVLRQLDTEVWRVVFCDRERARHFVRLIIEGLPIDDELLEVALSLV